MFKSCLNSLCLESFSCCQSRLQLSSSALWTWMNHPSCYSGLSCASAPRSWETVQICLTLPSVWFIVWRKAENAENAAVFLDLFQSNAVDRAVWYTVQDRLVVWCGITQRSVCFWINNYLFETLSAIRDIMERRWVQIRTQSHLWHHDHMIILKRIIIRWKNIFISNFQ